MLITGLLVLVGLAILYWVIRAAVRGALQDNDERRARERADA